VKDETTPQDPAIGVVKAIVKSKIDFSKISSIIRGQTLVINSIIEKKPILWGYYSIVVSTRQAEAKEVKVGRTLKRYWRLRVPKNLSRGAAAVVVEAGGERWQMSLDRHGRLYVPSRLRPMFEEAKTIMVRREDDTLVLKLLSYK
jgi:hypothetical protein